MNEISAIFQNLQDQVGQYLNSGAVARICTRHTRRRQGQRPPPANPNPRWEARATIASVVDHGRWSSDRMGQGPIPPPISIKTLIAALVCNHCFERLTLPLPFARFLDFPFGIGKSLVVNR